MSQRIIIEITEGERQTGFDAAKALLRACQGNYKLAGALLLAEMRLKYKNFNSKVPGPAQREYNRVRKALNSLRHVAEV